VSPSASCSFSLGSMHLINRCVLTEPMITKSSSACLVKMPWETLAIFAVMRIIVSTVGTDFISMVEIALPVMTLLQQTVLIVPQLSALIV